MQTEVLRAPLNALQGVLGVTANIERYAINDGFGLRTAVFLKGCPLRCQWCSNPETQAFHPEMSFFRDKCIACGACAHTCAKGAIGPDMTADRQKCASCHESAAPFACTAECYPECRKITGERMSARQVVDIVKRDMAFYELSGGGVTLSGGEPFAQPEFTYALLRLLRESWIDTAIETCAAAMPEDIEACAPYLDFVFADIKHMDPVKHEEWTGMRNGALLDNIKLLDALAAKHGFRLLLRVPVIPGFNATADEIASIGGFVKQNLRNAAGMELLPYHKLGRGKYVSLGREYPLAELKPPSGALMTELNKVLYDQGIELYQF